MDHGICHLNPLELSDSDPFSELESVGLTREEFCRFTFLILPGSYWT